jgi:predicted nucleic acid-binding protein
MPQSYYIDTDILIYYFGEHDRKDKRTIARKLIKQIINNINNTEITVKIPQVVLGELMLSFYERKCELVQMIDLLREDLRVDIPNASFEVLECAQELRRRDAYITPNDALIVSQALLDNSTTWLFTTDQELIGNMAINEKMDSLDHRFSIASRFNSR